MVRDLRDRLQVDPALGQARDERLAGGRLRRVKGRAYGKAHLVPGDAAIVILEEFWSGGNRLATKISMGVHD